MQILTEETSIIIKSIFASIVLFALARIMGKKQIAQLTYFDYIVGISIGSIAAVMSIDKSVPILDGFVSMVVWALFAVIFSLVSMKSVIARRWFDGTPSILIQNGKIVEKNLKKVKFNVNDLLEELRVKDVFNIMDVEFAILETNGKLSVLKKAAMQPVTPTDMNLTTMNSSLFANVIMDGKLMRQNMEQLGIDEATLKKELTKNNINAVKDVLLACYDSNGVLFVDKKNADPNDLNVLQ